jgi:hypothetical protein
MQNDIPISEEEALLCRERRGRPSLMAYKFADLVFYRRSEFLLTLDDGITQRLLVVEESAQLTLVTGPAVASNRLETFTTALTLARVFSHLLRVAEMPRTDLPLVLWGIHARVPSSSATIDLEEEDDDDDDNDDAACLGDLQRTYSECRFVSCFCLDPLRDEAKTLLVSWYNFERLEGNWWCKDGVNPRMFQVMKYVTEL